VETVGLALAPQPIFSDLKGREWFAACDAEWFNSMRYSFVWNEDSSAFRPVWLLWWDDASYIAYQSVDLVDY